MTGSAVQSSSGAMPTGDSMISRMRGLLTSVTDSKSASVQAPIHGETAKIIATIQCVRRILKLSSDPERGDERKAAHARRLAVIIAVDPSLWVLAIVEVLNV